MGLRVDDERVKTGAAPHLFRTRPDGESVALDADRADLFHRFTAKLLWLSRRSRPDLQPPVSFLTTRVQSSDEDDWEKLARALAYLRRTQGMRLALEADDLQSMTWWVD